MTCPDCGHDNIDGMDACEHCGQDLRSIDIPAPTHGLQRTIMETPLRELSPLPALTVEVTETIASVVGKMRKGGVGSAMVLAQADCVEAQVVGPLDLIQRGRVELAGARSEFGTRGCAHVVADDEFHEF